MCDNCLAENEWKANEVNQHEMANFGGAYGLVTYIAALDITKRRLSGCLE